MIHIWNEQRFVQLITFCIILALFPQNVKLLKLNKRLYCMKRDVHCSGLPAVKKYP
jgi:hypothetical protein